MGWFTDKLKRMAAYLSTPTDVGLSDELGTSLSTYADYIMAYYVIIGRGAAAMVNHTTLRQTEAGKNRVGTLKMLHIGAQDPWLHYIKHDMGQYPHLLGLPGYHKRPNLDEEDPKKPRDSTIFAAETAFETHLVRRKCEFLSAFVALIQPRGTGVPAYKIIKSLEDEGIDCDPLYTSYPLSYPRYRLLVVNTKGNSDFVYADKIDICSGSGRPRVLGDYVRVSGLDEEEYSRTKLWKPPESWGSSLKKRKVVCGTEALYKETTWEDAKKICVIGGGGVGVNMIERGEMTHSYLDWFASRTLHDSFLNPRNDILLKKARNQGGARFVAGEYDGGDRSRDTFTDLPINPAEEGWRFGQGTEVESVTGRPHDLIRLSFMQSKRARGTAPQLRDYWEKDIDRADGHFAYSTEYADEWEDEIGDGRLPGAQDFHRLIVSSGQDPREVGQAEQVAQLINFSPLTANDGRMVGLVSDDGRVRVLGAAAVVNGAWIGNPTAYTKMVEYRDTLPVMAIFGGFTFNCLNVATANYYFIEKPNKNVNTMTLGELKLLLKHDNLATKIVEKRAASTEGFRDKQELVDAIRGDALVFPMDWQTRLDTLAYTYRPADDFVF